MPNPRSPAREIAYRLWLDSGGKRPLVAIASECGVSPGLIRKWKNQDQWTLEGKKKSESGVTQNEPVTNGNGNAEDDTGNGAKAPRRRGHHNPKSNENLQAPPKGNKRAVTAGEYETILYETLSASERRLAAASLELSPVEGALRSLAVLTVREKRIMERINNRMDLAGDTVNVGGGNMFVYRALNTKSDSADGNLKKQSIEYENVIGFVTTLEEALTRIQAAKARVIALLHKMRRDSVMTDLERRKVEAMEQRTEIDRKRFEFEYGRGSGDGQHDPIAGWLDATNPTEESISAMFTVDDGEESP